MDIEEIIINLKILQSLDKNQKLVTRGSYINIESPSLIPEFIRRWNRQENRSETIKKINNIITDLDLHKLIIILYLYGFSIISFL